MRLDHALFCLTLFSSAVASVIGDQNRREMPRAEFDVAVAPEVRSDDKTHELYRRRGGGGGGGRGGGGGGGKSSGSSSGSGKGSSGSGSSGSRGTSSSSNAGGTSSRGSGSPRTYGGGAYYGGGATVPYTAGRRSPLGLLPFVLVGGALAFWPGVWLYGAYMYPYSHPYTYYNSTSRRNETRDVLCGCAQYAVCGCDDNNNTSYLGGLIGNGSYQALNRSVVNLGRYNGSERILINGTLPNGTTAQGSDSPAVSTKNLVEMIGFWPVVATVLAAVFMT